MKFQACLYGFGDVNGGTWTTLASGQTRKSYLNLLSIFLARQPLHHWGIRKNSLIKLYSMESGFIETLSIA